MAFTFDPATSAKNVAKRGLSFQLVERLDWEAAAIIIDDRRDYGETRLRVMALLDGRPHVAVVAPQGQHLRVISFRRANRREVENHGERLG